MLPHPPCSQSDAGRSGFPYRSVTCVAWPAAATLPHRPCIRQPALPVPRSVECGSHAAWEPGARASSDSGQIKGYCMLAFFMLSFLITMLKLICLKKGSAYAAQKLCRC